MLKFTEVTLRRGPRILFEQVNMTIHQGQHVGITGANGTGKSSLFALIMGGLHTDQGDFTLSSNLVIAHVAQETLALDRPAIE